MDIRIEHSNGGLKMAKNLVANVRIRTYGKDGQ